jgi:hypothetical protein
MPRIPETPSLPTTPFVPNTPLPIVRTNTAKTSAKGQGKGQKQKNVVLTGKARKRKRAPLWFAIASVITAITVVILMSGNGSGGAWMADTIRAIAGPVAAAQVESWYLGLTNTASKLQNKKVIAPWKQGALPSPTPTPPAKAVLFPMQMTSMTPLISPALPGEGQWSVLEQAPGKYSYLPLDAKSYIRPDPNQPYSLVTMLQFDPRFTRLHIIAGATEPGGPLNNLGTGVIPAQDQAQNTLLAALNGGFKYADGKYGLMTSGKVYVPPVAGAATIAITTDGSLLLGAWGKDPQLTSQNKDLVAWRQNASLLIDNGVVNPLTKDGAAWGGTILNSSYTWRSALGITSDGTLIYASGNALTAQTLGTAMKSVGAVYAMQTDINPFWVRAFLYHRSASGQLTIDKLDSQMAGTGQEYLQSMYRDFFYLTRYAPDNLTPPVTSGGAQSGPSLHRN